MLKELAFSSGVTPLSLAISVIPAAIIAVIPISSPIPIRRSSVKPLGFPVSLPAMGTM